MAQNFDILKFEKAYKHLIQHSHCTGNINSGFPCEENTIRSSPQKIVALSSRTTHIISIYILFIHAMATMCMN